MAILSGAPDRLLLRILCALAALIPASALGESLTLTHVPNAAPSVPVMAAPNTLSPELVQIAVAEGAMPLENPTALLTTYGYAADGPMVPPTNAIPGLDRTEASKTEPDKNTYLVLADQKGPDAAYDYGTHFLFQDHEDGLLAADRRPQGYLTRVNLDADAAHRVTLMADGVSDGRPFPFIDGSTFDPFANRLLLTGEGKRGRALAGDTRLPVQGRQPHRHRRGRWMDNVFIERLWRSLKYECVFLNAFETGSEARSGIGRWISYYNAVRPHSSFDGRTPDEVYAIDSK